MSDSFAALWAVALPGSSVHGILQASILGVGCHSLLQGVFLTQESNPGVLHGRQILYRLIHQGNLLAILKTVPLHSKSVWGKIPKHCVNEALNSQAGEGIPQRPQ